MRLITILNYIKIALIKNMKINSTVVANITFIMIIYSSTHYKSEVHQFSPQKFVWVLTFVFNMHQFPQISKLDVLFMPLRIWDNGIVYEIQYFKRKFVKEWFKICE